MEAVGVVGTGAVAVGVGQATATAVAAAAAAVLTSTSSSRVEPRRRGEFWLDNEWAFLHLLLGLTCI